MTEEREKRFLDDVFGIGKGQAIRQHIVNDPLLKLIKETNDYGFQFRPGFRWKLGRTGNLANSFFSVFGGQYRQPLGGLHHVWPTLSKSYHCAPGGSPVDRFKEKD